MSDTFDDRNINPKARNQRNRQPATAGKILCACRHYPTKYTCAPSFLRIIFRCTGYQVQRLGLRPRRYGRRKPLVSLRYLHPSVLVCCERIRPETTVKPSRGIGWRTWSDGPRLSALRSPRYVTLDRLSHSPNQAFKAILGSRASSSV